MMSYLWILLLGSLLASHAKAQEGDVAVAPETEETPTEPTEPAVDGEADGAAETEAPETEGELDTEDNLQPTPDPEPTADPEPAADPEPTADPEPAADPEPTADPAADPEPMADPVADPEPTTTPENENLEEESETSTALSAGLTTPAAPTEDGSGAVAAGPEPSTDTAEIEPSPTPQVNLDADVEEPEQTTPAPEVADTTAAPTQRDEIIEKKEGRMIYNQASEISASSDDPEPSTPKSSKNLAAILSGIIVSAVGAVTGYFAYQKRKLCFKNGQEPDLETGADKAAAAETKSEPHEQNTLLENPNQQPSD